MEETLLVEEPYYIQAPAAPADERTRVLKHGETFAIFDRFGDIRPGGLGEQGLYHAGTRFLSRMSLLINGSRPLLLSSSVREDNVLLSVDLTNPDEKHNGDIVLPHGSLHIHRERFLWEGVCYEQLRIRNFHLQSARLQFSLMFAADYADIFEVRGQTRPRRGQSLRTTVNSGSVVLAYAGLDGVVRSTHITCEPVPERVTPFEMRHTLLLQPRQEVSYTIAMACECGEPTTLVHRYQEALTEAGRGYKKAEQRECDVFTSNEQLNDWLNRSMADLRMMVTQTSEGPYPYAGVPWFNTAFGRDGIITALACLWVNPEIAKGVLRYLACAQAHEVIAEKDAEPGKILHETRGGEMAALNEVPFGRYYGSVDATPLFVMLAGAYYERTADRKLIESLWPHIELALDWIDTYGDIDGDGFVEYHRKSPTGLVQQGWKDSQDSVFHAGGEPAEGPIALCEVQGYVYEARVQAARLAEILGHDERAAALRSQAQALRENFLKAFWCEDIATYALALDGRKQPCRVRSSNAGHCLFSGIAEPEHARQITDSLLDNDFFNGWGIRTLSAKEARYNPMSYHNGSVWPHDNALIAAGMARYGFKKSASKVMEGLLDASIFVDLHRIPELFCGFARRPGEAPTLYPVACSPQAWASASVFLLLQSCLGLSIQAPELRLCLANTYLPPSVEQLRIRNLKIGAGSVSLSLHRYPQAVGVNVERREGGIEILSVK